MTVIGWVWIVLGGILVLKALMNLLTWSVLHSAAPALLQAFGERFANVPLVQTMLAHAGVMFLAQATFWTLVIVSAWNLLRLRPWARIAIQTVCGLGICYAAGFLIFWLGLWSHAGLTTMDPSLTESMRSLALFAGAGAILLLGSFFAVMLGYLRSARLRDAFTAPGSTR